MNIRIFDTTLRDGEQSPGVSLSPEKKLNIAKKLDQLGVDAIETGFPVISDGEKEGVKLIVGEGLKAELCGLARTNKKDIDAAVDCGLNFIHTFIATSDIHLEHKLKMTRDEALEKAISDLYDADGCVLAPSGMSAITNSFMGVLKSFDHALIPDCVYGSARRFVEEEFKRFQIEYDFYDPRDLSNLESKVKNLSLIHI